MSDVVWVAIGLLLLYVGAEWLVKGAAGLGRALGVRPLIVGLTIVAYGTSTPELIVSLLAAAEGRSEIALGNVVGSNIANLGLILGLTAVLRPLTVESSLIRRELPWMLATTLLLALLLTDGVVRRGEAAVALTGALLFTWWTARSGLAEAAAPALAEADAEALGAPRARSKSRLAVVAAIGLLLLVGGGELLVRGAVGLALALGVSQRVVGLTIVAVGTSAPELATCLVAALRRHSSMAVGNVVGSNIFNVLFVLGGAGLVRPIGGAGAGWALDLAALVVATVMASVLLYTERRVSRLEGALLTCAYGGYLTLLLLLR